MSSLLNDMRMFSSLTNSRALIRPINFLSWITVPTYPCGNIGFWILCNDANADPSKPRADLDQQFLDSVSYYSKVRNFFTYIYFKFLLTFVGNSRSLICSSIICQKSFIRK